MKRRTVSLLMVTVMALMGMTGCGSGEESKKDTKDVENTDAGNSVAEETAEASESEGKPMAGVHLEMAIDAEYAPFESVNSDGEIVGFDVDLNEALAEELGYTYNLNDMEFTGLISSISSGKCDYIISALTYSEERDEVVDFTDGYYTPVMAMVFKKDAGYTSMSDFEGKKVGTTLGSVYEDVVSQIDDVQLLTYDVVNEALPIIGTQELDAVLADTSNAISFCEQDDSLTYMVVSLSFTEGIVSDFSVLLPEGSEYVDDFNEALQTLKDNGTYEELIVKWFGEQYYEDLKTAQNE